MFDIYSAYGYGADVGPDFGPSQNLRRDIGTCYSLASRTSLPSPFGSLREVRSIKEHTKKIIVFSNVQAKVILMFSKRFFYA